MFMLVIGGTVDDGVESAAPTGAHEALDEMVFYSLNLDSRTWSRYYVPSSNPAASPVPQPRCHATLVCAPDNVLYYGGFPQSSSTADASKELMHNHWSVFRLSGEAEMSEVAVTGASPMLWGHSAVYAHGCLLVFGGVDHPSAAEVATLCVYHLDGQRWRWAEFPMAPPARALHTAVIDRGFMIVFGGFSTIEPVQQHQSSSVKSLPGEKAVSGDAAPASSPVSTYSPASSQFCDTWLFSLSTGLWTPLEASGTLPSYRSGHAACANNGLMFVFGGLESAHQKGSNTTTSTGGLSGESTMAILDLDTHTWSIKRLVTSLAPAATGGTSTISRQQHASSSLSPSPGRSNDYYPTNGRAGSFGSGTSGAGRTGDSVGAAEEGRRRDDLRPLEVERAITVGQARQLRSGGTNDSHIQHERSGWTASTSQQLEGSLGANRTPQVSDYSSPVPMQHQFSNASPGMAGQLNTAGGAGMFRDAAIPPVPVRSYYHTLAPDHSLLVDNVVRMQREREDQIRLERTKLQHDVAAAYARPSAPPTTFGYPLEEIPPSELLLSVPLPRARAAQKKLQRQQLSAFGGTPPSPLPSFRDASLHTVISPWTDLVDTDEQQRSTTRSPPGGRLLVKRSPPQNNSSSSGVVDLQVGEELDGDERVPTTVVYAPRMNSPPRSHSPAGRSSPWGLQYNPLLPGPSLPPQQAAPASGGRLLFPPALSPYDGA